jgi:hypothetical protein
MEHIQTTDEMGQRIRKNIERHRRQKKLLKMWLPVLGAAAAAVLFLTIRVMENRNVSDTASQSGQETTDIYESQDYSSLEQLSEAVGFEVQELRNLPFTVQETEYTAIGKDLAQVSYTGAENAVIFRKSVGTEDNSGDFTVYGEQTTVESNNLDIHLSGEDGSTYLASWTDGTYAYSLSIEGGVAETEAMEMVGQITG